MKKLLAVVGMATVVALLGACSQYNGVATSGKRVYLVKNKSVFGFNVRSVDVCDTNGSGDVTNCRPAMP